MRVALVHDDLFQWGGSERVLEAISEIYPDAPIFTSVVDYSNPELRKRFGLKKIYTSFLQKIPGRGSLYKEMLPFYPLAFEQFLFDGYDLVISNTTRFAKSIITKPQTMHICYCHTPPRFLWHFSGEKNYGLLETLMNKLRIYDQVSAKRVDRFLAGSLNAQKRIKKIYKSDAKVVYPFVDLQRFNGVEAFDGGYYLIVGRPNKYKMFDLAKEACSKAGVQLRVIDGSFSDEMAINIMAGCKALIIAGEEDFGISSLEAQALGKSVIAFKAGGALETVKEGETGFFFESQTVGSLVYALKNISQLDGDKCKENAGRFSKEKFISNFKQSLADLG